MCFYAAIFVGLFAVHAESEILQIHSPHLASKKPFGRHAGLKITWRLFVCSATSVQFQRSNVQFPGIRDRGVSWQTYNFRGSESGVLAGFTYSMFQLLLYVYILAIFEIFVKARRPLLLDFMGIPVAAQIEQ
jgi:hypothetical protein